MSWREQIRDKASFRGVEFFTDSHDTGGLGRRIAKHRYPGRPGQWAEDLGPQIRTFSLPAYLVGENYLADRDRLIEALDQEGPGTLVHPWLGRLQVAVEESSLSETTREGGMCRFQITFTPAGENTTPSEAPDTQEQVRAESAAVRTAVKAVFEDQFSVAGAPEWSVDAIRDRLTELSGQIRTSSDDLAGWISSPADLAGGIVDAVVNLYNTSAGGVGNILRALDWGRQFPPITLNTPLRRQQATNQAAIRDLAQVAGAASGAESLADTEFPSQQEAGEALDAINDVIDGVQSNTDPEGNPIDDTVYYRLQDLRAAVVADIRERGLRLPEVASHTPATTMPALLIAHRLYGDATREADIVTRNRIRHPGFVPGGEPLEVLRDV